MKTPRSTSDGIPGVVRVDAASDLSRYLTVEAHELLKCTCHAGYLHEGTSGQHKTVPVLPRNLAARRSFLRMVSSNAVTSSRLAAITLSSTRPRIHAI